MLKIILGLLLTFIVIDKIYSQEIKELLVVPWDTVNGIKTIRYPNGTYGIKEFEMLNEYEIAFFCDSENKIKIYNIPKKELLNEFELEYSASNFTYDHSNSLFYVRAREKIFVYLRNGKLQKSFDYNNSNELQFCKKIGTNNDCLCLISGIKTYNLIENKRVLSFNEQVSSVIDGELLNDGYYTKYPGIIETNTSTFKIFKNSVSNNYSIDIGMSGAGPVPIGVINGFVVLEICYEKKNNKHIPYERLIFYSTKSKRIIKSIDIPRIYYTGISRSFVFYNNSIYQVITATEGALLLKFDFENLKSESNLEFSYPKYLNYEYHYNEEQQKSN